MMNRTRVTMTGIGMFAVAALSVAPLLAAGQNYGRSWEENAGTRIYGYVQFKASYNDGGRKAKQAYQRFRRDSGPSLDTGRMYTAQANSKKDTRVYSRTDWVLDSPLWGDAYTTRYFYGFTYW